MPATALAAPTLSQIQAWSIDHLETAATTWESIAENWEYAFDRVHRETPAPGGTSWTGAGADAAVLRTGTDRLVVMGAADSLNDAANAARKGASEIAAARQLVLQAIERAQSAGFEIGEDLSITSYQAVPAALRTATEAEAQKLAASIWTRAAALLSVDEQAAADVRAAIEGLNRLHFDETPITPADGNANDPTIQLVDNQIFRESPADDPGIPPGGWSEDPGMRAAQRIAYGHAWRDHGEQFPGITRDQLAEVVHDMMTGNPKTDPNLFVGPGERNTTVMYKDGILAVYDPNTSDGGTVFKPDRGFGKFLDLTAPIFSAPPTMPAPNHLPEPVPPAQTNLPPTVKLPPLLPTPDLPLWLQNPAPPGFEIAGSGQKPGPIPAPWDAPDLPTVPVTPGVAASTGPVSSPVNADAVGPAAIVGIGGALVSGLFGALTWLAHPFQVPG